MLRAIYVVDHLSAVVPLAYYVNEFPENALDSAVYVQVTGGFPPDPDSAYRRTSFQVLIRGGEFEMQETEDLALTIHSHLNGRAEFELSGQFIRQCVADQPVPLYIGRDENKRPMYSLNFTCVYLE
ncbi:minor capsid protein [Paenibacillus silvisoli]|uniref:minor capsid protein n=1 Tax=Paenibacillus silvisoli TaxID=3110539 RepID=UPI002804154F|nr:minor capsid protein [Paenibacillus silvisoli]